MDNMDKKDAEKLLVANFKTIQPTLERFGYEVFHDEEYKFIITTPDNEVIDLYTKSNNLYFTKLKKFQPDGLEYFKNIVDNYL